ncbi:MULTISPECIES: YSC84-related protein [Paracoccaceae]|jgi:lipid-binding SYLF domain-containing protein|uniref:lipid-binding SYLF domain-containing protein n=1 Tax=Rhodobacterales TaxID=204455 RepID=UPI001B2DCE0B|nr:YSC84-related protein [Boseongicola sp. H5]MBO6604218.1 twin-arginine translocation pathway signal [Roseicyclus sp.]MBO6625738.1 twin-arginine translocation pathway signal [Roseicyclus sp.]MBO6922405.1 twin-arginine translocation pathway signal [Roseicyclus sp.]
MSKLTRRHFVVTAAAVPLAACGNGVGSDGASRLDARVDSAIQFMYDEVPGTQELSLNAAGMLVMPLVTQAGFGFGGSYGRGALRINGASVDYYSAVSGSFGFQIGAQQYAHTLFFMTDAALNEFRRSSGWAVGADVQYAVTDQGANLGVDTTTLLDPVIAVIYGQAGLIAGATLEGTRYSRIIP